MASSITRQSRTCLARRPLALACALLCAGAATAQQAAQGEALRVSQAPALKPVVISASREEQDPDSLPMSIDVIDAGRMEREQAGDIREMVNLLPNVDVPRSPARFSMVGSPTGRDQNSGFNIRGLEGNRVLMLVDGVRLPRSYSFSANSFGRDYLDLGLVQRVEILRGAAPALYGSDGMGGLVNFVTVQPDDLLGQDKAFGGRIATSYDGSDNGRKIGATLAGRASPEWSWLLSAGLGRSSALENMGTNNVSGGARTTPNPEKDRSSSLMGRLVFTPSAAQKHVFTLENVDKRADYQLLSARTSTVANSDARTNMKRWRASWQGQWRQLGLALADELQLMASYQKSDAREFADETRIGLPYRARDVTYDEGAVQLHAQASRQLRWSSSASGRFTYGLDYARNKVVNEQTGVTPPVGESFPLKRFPDTTETASALFAQAELHNGPWSVTPGVRAERYSIKPKQAGFVPPVARNSDSAITPKLGVMLQASPAWSFYGNYAAGFRAPNAGQINAFFENPIAFYKTIPNPNLRPEKSQTFELGLKGRMDRLRVDAAVFTGRYKDFIVDQQQVSGQFGNPANPAVFQSVNVGRARISGFELKADYDWGRWAGGDWQTRMAYGYADGKDTQAGTPLDSISPQQLVLGVRYEQSAVDVQFNVSHWSGKKAGDVSNGSAAWLTPSATVVDLSAQWRIRPDLRLNAGIYNLTDKKHWRWADVRGLTAGTAIADAYSQPGRHVRISLVKDF